MKIAVAGDSAGEPLVKVILEHLSSKSGLEIADLSKPENNEANEFYAGVAERTSLAILDGRFDRGILVCGTGIGVCISANKVPGIRAALTHDTYSAERAQLSNNAQIITMGARVIGSEVAKSIVDAWLRSEFDANGRSAGNVDAMDALDKKYNK
ncbi:RpiB/LacA/LacB family sugar-phosphate isomerase [Mesorhizobium sp. SB112]|uniref:D-erythrulose-4-phosphate isomerase n=1 Tax=Mesorhizobium sp. SB112 TaxID=3151853 RepID=UPI003267CA0A